MPGFAPRPLTDDMRAEAIRLARAGYTIETIANAIGHSRASFQRRRAENPDFEADLLAAIAQWDIAMSDAIDSETDPAMARILIDRQTRRLPMRYSLDPRIRARRAHIDDDTHSEDRDDGASAMSAGEQLQAAINAMLDDREGPVE